MAIQNFKIKHGLNLGDHELIDSSGNINLPIGANIQIAGAPLDALPDQTNQVGKYLTTDGSVAAWATISQPTLVSQLTNDAGYQTSVQVASSIAALVDSAPGTLNTLNELAAALGDDPNFATTIATQIGTKWTQDNTKISHWDSAYSWGNHASAGYLNYSTLSDGSGHGFKVGPHLSYYAIQTESTASGVYFNDSFGFIKANYVPILQWDQNKVTIKNSMYTDTITLNGSTGALTAVSFIGDGSQLTGVATSGALALKADLSGATFTGTIKTPTLSSEVKSAASKQGIQWTDDVGTKLFGLSVYGTANTYSPSLVWNSGNPTGNFTGGASVVIGGWAAPNASGSSNSIYGYGAGYSLTSGVANTFLGANAGYTNSGSGNNNTFLGANTSPLAANQSNQTVIGYGATGNGSNTVTIGNSSITDTYLKGIIHGDAAAFTGDLTAQKIKLSDSNYRFSNNEWAGSTGYPGYTYSGVGNSRFGFSAVDGILDVYTDGGFFAPLGSITAASARINGGESYAWAHNLFSSVVKGLGDGGFRSQAVIGNASGSSSWFGSTTTPQFAIDTANSSAALWLNNGTTAVGSWFKMIDFSYNGATNFYGGGGGSSVVLWNGGDQRIYASNNTSFTDIWCDPNPVGTIGPSGGNSYLWTSGIYLKSQHCSYDRGWNNNPSITVVNNTEYGSQSEFRIHGANGVSGGDFSVVVVSDGGYSSSDRRRKTGIQNIENALATVLQLQGRKYQYVNSELEPQLHMSDANGFKFGFIAQEIENIVPEMVHTIDGDVAIPNENGYADGYSVDYGSMVALLTEALKEQQIQINDLKAENADLALKIINIMQHLGLSDNT